MMQHSDSSYCSSSDDEGPVYVDNSRHGHQQYNTRGGGGGGYAQPQVVYVRGEQQAVGDQEENVDDEEIGSQEIDDQALESHITMDDFRHGIFTQDFYVEIEGSMSDFGQIDGLAEWTPDAGSEHIFQRVGKVVNGVPERVGNLKNGVMLGARWKWYRNPHDVDVGLEITGVLGNVHSRTGECYSAVVPSNKFYKDGEQCFRPSHIMSRNMLENYAVCNIEELNNDIKPEANAPWSYVKASSVIIDLLKANKEFFGIEMKFPASREGLMKVNNKIIDVCREYLKEQHDIPFIDFNKFSVKAHRMGSEPWDSVKGIINDISGHDEADKAHFETTRMHDTKKICGVLELTVALMK